jgi:hypothetical protein
MTGWTKVTGGWALNLDGSDAASVFSLPRLEAQASPRGWLSRCLLEDGSRRERPAAASDSVWTARSAAVALAGQVLGPAHAAALAALRDADRA